MEALQNTGAIRPKTNNKRNPNQEVTISGYDNLY